MTPEGGGNKATEAPPPVPTAATRPPRPPKPPVDLAGALGESGGSPLPSQRGWAVGQPGRRLPKRHLGKTQLSSRWRGKAPGLLLPGASGLATPRLSAALEEGGGGEEGILGGGGREGGGERVTDFGSTLQLAASTGFPQPGKVELPWASPACFLPAPLPGREGDDGKRGTG